MNVRPFTAGLGAGASVVASGLTTICCRTPCRALAEQGDEAVQQVVRNMQALHQVSGQIGSISELIGDGLVELTREERLRVSSEGFPVLDAVVADLAA